MKVGQRIKATGEERVFIVHSIWHWGQNVQQHPDPESCVLECADRPHDPNRFIVVNPRRYKLVPAD